MKVMEVNSKFEDPLRKEFYERRIRDLKTPYMTVEEGLEKVRTGMFAIHTDLTMGYDVVKSTYAEDEKCGFEEIDYFYTSDPTFTIKQKSPYAEIFRVGGIWLEETGLAQRFIDRIYHKKPTCTNQKKFISVGTIDCYAAYLVIAYGLAASLMILLCEVFWFKKCDTRSADANDELEDQQLPSTASSPISNQDHSFETLGDEILVKTGEHP
ncbi:uncharacterized protein [Fopius arisanus]|uniref:Uncharacterized protein n=1 Tax=Fopius arisanus TaxID=64838 RepID=A0A9R1T1C8_9HYME|nr:PREDICTED: uncharacterized protein LOC105265262 [Fopius arisanus]